MSCKSRHIPQRMVALLTKLGRIIDRTVTVVEVVVYRCGCTRQRIVGRVLTDDEVMKFLPAELR